MSPPPLTAVLRALLRKYPLRRADVENEYADMSPKLEVTELSAKLEGVLF